VIDLHMHSIYSDGSDEPEDLVAAASRRGLRGISLTDHDTVGGVRRFLEAAAREGVPALSGVEISVDTDEGPMHLLGYGFDREDAPLNDRLHWLREGRNERNREILEKLRDLGKPLSMEQVRACAGAEVVGRPHIADALVRAGLVKSRDAAFKLYLGKGGNAYVDRRRLAAAEAIALIRAAGGAAVMAHPVTMKRGARRLERLISALQKAGLSGIEVYHPEHTAKQTELYRRLADEGGLVATGGTDYHGVSSPDIRLGVGFGSLRVPDDCWDALAQRLGLTLSHTAGP